jgi:hypothetical protein
VHLWLKCKQSDHDALTKLKKKFCPHSASEKADTFNAMTGKSSSFAVNLCSGDSDRMSEEASKSIGGKPKKRKLSAAHDPNLDANDKVADVTPQGLHDGHAEELNKEIRVSFEGTF